MPNRNIIFPSIVILFSALAFAVTTQFDEPMYQDASVDAKFFPMVISIALIVISFILLVQSKLEKSSAEQQAIMSKMALFGVAFLIGYALLISVVGYLLASLSAFIFYLLFFRIKKPLYYLIAVVFVLLVYYLFGEVFYISLPQAIWA